MNSIETQKQLTQEVIEEHLSKTYSDYQVTLDMDYLLNKYQLFPYEGVYIVDCKYAQFEPLTKNFMQIIGVNRPHQNDVSLLLEYTDEQNYSALHRWVMTNLKEAFYASNGLQIEKDVFKCLYRTYDKRVLLKCTTPLMYDDHGIMRYSLGKLIDVTHMVPFYHFGYQYEGPNKSLLYEQHRKYALEASELTTRESEILMLINHGLTSLSIAKRLYISVHTVDTHRRNIIQKLEVNSTIEAYQKCKNLGWA